jgi:L-threonylcarbamoyladenylate synthase
MPPPIVTDIDQAVAVLRRGGVVAVPTETVYGLAADARNPAAVRRVFSIKGRPADHPLIVHIAEAGRLADWARDIPPAAYTLADAFWPGPLTLILKRQPDVPDIVTGGQDTVGLRVPDHPLTLELLRRFGGGLAAPSANRFGRISPTLPRHVADELGDAVDLILDGGPCAVGVESTIVNLTVDPPVVLRPGGIVTEALSAALGVAVRCAGRNADVRAPGLLESHYAPVTPVELLPAEALRQESARRGAAGERIAVMLRGAAHAAPAGVSHVVMPDDAEAYARMLYATLRRLDAGGFDRLLVESVPDTDAWLAVADRLRRAAAKQPGV